MSSPSGATTASPLPNRHKHPPIAFRPPEGDRVWLLTYAQQTGQPVNRILARALAAFRTTCDAEVTPAP